MVTTRVSPARQAASASRRPDRARVAWGWLAGQAVVDVDPVGLDADGREALALRGQVLGVGDTRA